MGEGRMQEVEHILTPTSHIQYERADYYNDMIIAKGKPAKEE